MAKTKNKATISPLMGDIVARSKVTNTMKVRTPRIRKKPAKLRTTPEAPARERSPSPVSNPSSHRNSMPGIGELEDARKTKRVSEVVTPIVDQRKKGAYGKQTIGKKADEGMPKRKKGDDGKETDGKKTDGRKADEGRHKSPPKKLMHKRKADNVDPPPLDIVNEEQRPLRRSPRKLTKPRTTVAQANSQPVSDTSRPDFANTSQPLPRSSRSHTPLPAHSNRQPSRSPSPLPADSNRQPSLSPPPLHADSNREPTRSPSLLPRSRSVSPLPRATSRSPSLPLEFDSDVSSEDDSEVDEEPEIDWSQHPSIRCKKSADRAG